MYTKEIKAEAVRLRIEGRMSFPEILKKVKVAKSTLSLWLKDYPLTEGELSTRRKVCGRKRLGVNQPPTEWLTRPPLSKSDLGEACRQMISAKLMLNGIQVLRPLNEDTPIDLVILTADGRFLKCQCKCVYKPKATHSHLMPFISVRKWGPNSKAVIHHYTALEVDIFLGYCPDNDAVYVIPHAEVEGRQNIPLWITSTNKSKSPDQVRWENNFETLKMPS